MGARCCADAFENADGLTRGEGAELVSGQIMV